MKQELRLEQKQIVTPQLLLNLKLLALPNLELEILVRNELEQNPALELISEPTEPTEKETETTAENESDIELATTNDEFDIGELISDDVYSLPSEAEATVDSTEITTCNKNRLEDTLLTIIKAQLPEADTPIIEYILGNLDEDGFLPIPVEEISQTFNTTPEHIKDIIKTIQQIEPGGIASQNLKQALLCQLKLQGFDENSLEVKLIRDHYELVFKRQYAKIIKSLGITESDLSSAILNLKNLEPKPARRYLFRTTEYINPDFSIEWRDNNLVAVINDETIPVLRIASRFREMLLHPKNFTEEEVNFARQKAQGALNLIKAIEARKRLLLCIVNYIIISQREFFLRGKEYIKPIPIKSAAEEIRVHISTLSRACQGKYVETPVGIYPLKFFFTTGIGEHSRHSLKEKIQNLINSEDKTKPFTDDEIVNLLAQQNIHLSRRTVAKYRDELSIPGSTERKEK